MRRGDPRKTIAQYLSIHESVICKYFAQYCGSFAMSVPPYNFSWIVEKELAGMAWPQTVSNLEFLIQEGISHLVTLSPEKIPPKHPNLQWTKIDVEEFEAPTIDDIIRFIEICEKCRASKQVRGVKNRLCGIFRVH